MTVPVDFLGSGSFLEGRFLTSNMPSTDWTFHELGWLCLSEEEPIQRDLRATRDTAHVTCKSSVEPIDFDPFLAGRGLQNDPGRFM
jgi:hypothetical protein